MKKKKHITIDNISIELPNYNHFQEMFIKTAALSIILNQKENNYYFIKNSMLYPMNPNQIFDENIFFFEIFEKQPNFKKKYTLFSEITIDDKIYFLPSQSFIDILNSDSHIMKNIIVNNVRHRPCLYLLEYLKDKQFPYSHSFELSEIKEILGLENQKYGNYPQNFKSYILDIIEKESERADLQTKFTVKKTKKENQTNYTIFLKIDKKY